MFKGNEILNKLDEMLSKLKKIPETSALLEYILKENKKIHNEVDVFNKNIVITNDNIITFYELLKETHNIFTNKILKQIETEEKLRKELEEIKIKYIEEKEKNFIKLTEKLEQQTYIIMRKTEQINKLKQRIKELEKVKDGDFI